MGAEEEAKLMAETCKKCGREFKNAHALRVHGVYHTKVGREIYKKAAQKRKATLRQKNDIPEGAAALDRAAVGQPTLREAVESLKIERDAMNDVIAKLERMCNAR